MKSRFLLTERNVNKTFISGLRLNVDDAESHPHKESNLVDITAKPHIKRINFTNTMKSRNDQDELNVNRGMNRFKKNNDIDLKFKTQIEFNDFQTQPPVYPSLKNKKILQLNESIVEEPTLKPSQSQLIRIKALNGSNPVTLLSNTQIVEHQKKNKIPSVKQTQAANIHNSGGMKISLKSDQNWKVKEEVIEKIVNYPATVIQNCGGMTEKRKQLRLTDTFSVTTIRLAHSFTRH